MKKLLAALLLSVASLASGATGDILSVEIAPNGWQALIEIEGLGTGGTYSTRLGHGPNNVPEDGDPDIVFTVTSPGFDGNGNLGTIERTVYGTKEVRQPWPNDATNDEDANGGDVIVKVALSDYIYEDDEAGVGKSGTDVTYDINAGFYTQGSANNAATGTATNNSTAPYQPPVYNWSWPGRERVTSEWLLQMHVYHRHAQDGRPVPLVRYEITDGTNTIEVDSQAPELDYAKRGANIVPEYIGHYGSLGTNNSDDFLDDAVLTCNATIYPWVGNTAYTTSTGAAMPSPLVGPRYLYNDTDDDQGLWAMVDPVNGDDSTGTAVAFIDFDVAVPAYETIDGARADGATDIWLTAGTHSVGEGGTTASASTPDYWVTIRSAFGVDTEDCILATGGKFTDNLGERVKFQDLTITSTTVNFIEEIDEVWIHDCIVDTTSTNLFDNDTGGVLYATNSTFTELGQGLSPATNDSMAVGLVRGCTFGASFSGYIQTYVAVGNTSYAVTGRWQDYRTQWGNCPEPDGIVVAFNQAYDFDQNSEMANFCNGPVNGTASVTAAAIVGNVFEKVGSASSWCVNTGAEDDDPATDTVDNVMLWNNVFVGARCGLAYNSEGTSSRSRSYWSLRNNYWEVRGLKVDTFGTQSGNRTGSWPVLFGVGSSGEVDAGIADLGSTGLDSEWGGLSSLEPVGAGVSYAQFEDRGGTVQRDPEIKGSGQGDYYLTASSPLVGMAYTAPVPYDLEQSPRVAGDATGAYTYYPATGTTYYVRHDGDDSNTGLVNDAAGAKLTVQAAMDVATTPGDIVHLEEGYYREDVECSAHGAARAKITLTSTEHKATIRQYSTNEFAHNKLTSIRVHGYGDDPLFYTDQDGNDEFSGLVYISQNSHHTVIDDCHIDAGNHMFVDNIRFQIRDAGFFGVKDAPASFCEVTNNTAYNNLGGSFLDVNGDDNIIRYNTFEDGEESDFLRLFGRDNIIQYNRFERNVDRPDNTGNHLDFIQTFGTQGDLGSSGHLIDGNYIAHVEGQITQLTDAWHRRMVIGDWTFSNNIIKHTWRGSSCSIQAVKWYNNLFYEVNVREGNAVSAGERGWTGLTGVSGAHGFEAKNNVFLESGGDTVNRGWYAVDLDLVNCSADYNYVAKEGYVAVDEDPGQIPIGGPGDWWETPTFDGEWWEDNGINGGDPDIIHRATEDFRPRTGSLLIGAGTASTGVTTDFFGNTRPGTPSIGPFEEFPDDVFYLATTGDNGDTGGSADPWLTLAFAESQMTGGDVLLIQPGTYDEEVAVNGPAATSTRARTRFVADGAVTVTSMRIQEPYVELNGITFHGMQNVTNGWDSHVRLEKEADYALIENCTFGPGIYSVTNSEWLSIDGGTETVTGTGADFAAAGFKSGGHVRIGMTTFEPEGGSDNHFPDGDGNYTIDTVGTTTMVLNEDLTGHVGSKWSVVYAGADKSGISGITNILAGGDAADWVRVTGCTFDDLFGHGVKTQGNYNRIDHCTFTNQNSWSSARLRGDHIRFHHNLIKDATNGLLYFTTAETAFLEHDSGDPWDFAIGHLHTEATEGDSLQIYRNWIQNMEQPWSQIGEQTGDTIVVMWGNVFVGTTKPGSNGRHFSHIYGNTWYRCGIEYPFDSGVGMGGNSPNTADHWIFRRNACIDVGSRQSPDDEFYSLVDLGGTFLVDHNYAVSPETLNYSAPANFVGLETHGVEGGAPLLVDPADPLGPDGLPFTEDDGLRFVPSSPLMLGNGTGDPEDWEWWDEYYIGALTPIDLATSLTGTTGSEPNGESYPVAIFKITAISTGFSWNDSADMEVFNPTWYAMEPYERTGEPRPWDTPEKLGELNVNVTFDASDSLDGLVNSTYTNAGITSYAWTTSDGGSGSAQTFGHTFTTDGTHTVSLTITNSDGITDTRAVSYRVGDGTAEPEIPGAVAVDLQVGGTVILID